MLTLGADTPAVPSLQTVDELKRGQTVEDFALWDAAGESHRLYLHGDSRGVVLVSFSASCPTSLQSLSELRSLGLKFRAQGVTMFLIDSDPRDSRTNLARLMAREAVPIPVLLDEGGLISAPLALARTGTYLLLNPASWTVAGSGSIAAGKSGSKALLADVAALLDGQKLDLNSEAGSGCLIQPRPRQHISYIRDIVPILSKRCLHCHNTKGKAPWAMTDFEKVKGWSAMIREVIRTMRMPPRHLDPQFVKMQDDNFHWLSADEKIKLIKWVEQGAPRGTGTDLLPELQGKVANDEWPFGPPDLIIPFGPELTLPATGWVDWKWREIDHAIPQDSWIRGIYIKSSNSRVVHHASLWAHIESQFQTPLATAKGHKERADRLIEALRLSTLPVSESDYEEIRNSARIFQIADTPDNWELLGASTPGIAVPIYPESTGKFIPGGAKLRIITHYRTTGRPERETPTVGIYFAKKAAQPLRPFTHIVLQNNAFSIPTGARNYKVHGYHLFESDVTLYGAAPHVHYRGMSMKLTAHLPNGNEQVIFSAPDHQYEFLSFEDRFAHPISLPAGTIMVMETVFDNSTFNPRNPNASADRPFGWQLNEEMCWAVLAYTKK